MRKRVVVVGGYGAVGSEVCRHLARDARVEVVVAGRSEDKARALASEVGGAALALDALAPGAALEGASAIVNCFIGLGAPSTALAEAAIAGRMLYLDVAGLPAEHLDAVLALGGRAAAAGATLVTALGCNPGIPGLLALECREGFERLDEVDFYFCLGSKLAGLSVLSLQGVGQMMKAGAEVWREGAWHAQKGGSEKRRVGPPLDKSVYFGPAYVTRDLVALPERLGVRRLAFHSGIESTLQGMVFLAGVRLGGTRKPERAARMLRWLRAVGGRGAHEEAVLELVATGERQGRPATRHVVMACTEELFTALAPAIVVEQWLDGEITRPGAFVPPEVVPAASFVERLRRAPTAWRETWA